MSSRLRYSLFVSLLFPLLLTSKTPARPELIDFDWRSDDVVLVLSDSARFEVDLAASDTSEVVMRLKNVVISERVRQSASGAEVPSGGLAISLIGRGGRTASLSEGSSGETTVRIHDDQRLGYSVEWRPFTHQIVIHTFDWSAINEATTHYHEGLIALEQGAVDQAVELLQIAGAAGETRAHGVLASMYARRGEDSLASYYLRDPRTAEDYAALAAVQSRAGDSSTADESRARSEQLLVDRDPAMGRGSDRGDVRADVGGDDMGRRRRGDGAGGRGSDVILFAVIGGFVILLIIGLIILASRRARPTAPTAIRPASPPPVPPTRNSTGFRVVETVSPASETVPTSTPEKTAEDLARTTDASAPSSSIVVAEDTVSRPSEQSQSQPSVPSTPTSSSTEPSSSSTTSSSSTATSTWASTSMPARPSSSDAPGSVAGAPPRVEPPASDESTVAAARRMGVSRDNVDLRRRMDDAARRDPKQD